RVGRQLASSVENYNKAVGSLERSVLPGARKFTELGVQGKRDIEKLDTLDPVPRTMIEGNDS
ncbi:MAG: DNA recombination protein RmuC, partial [Woeseiaceae bacterium]